MLKRILHRVGVLQKISKLFSTSDHTGELYSTLVQSARLNAEKDPVSAIEYAKIAAAVGWGSNTSNKHDKNLDEIVHAIGSNHQVDYPKSHGAEIVLVTSGIIPFSGLTLMVINLVKHLPKNAKISIWSTEFFSHSDPTSDQGKMLEEYADINVIDKDIDSIANAQEIGQWASNKGIKSFLYFLSPNDVIGNLLPSMLPQEKHILVNVSHHVFSLGSLQFDAIIDISDYYFDETLGEQRNPNTFLIYQSGREAFSETTKVPAKYIRKDLGISSDAMLTVTVGNPKKNLWNNDQSYIEIIGEMLMKHGHVHHILIAKGMEEIRTLIVNKFPSVSDRLHVIPGTNELIAVLKDCDIYLNSFPVGGALSSLDAIAAGLPIVSIPAQSKWFKIPEITAFNKSEYLEVITWYLEDEEFRNEQIKSLQDFYIKNHDPSVVAKNFSNLLDRDLAPKKQFGESADFAVLGVKRHINVGWFDREVANPFEKLTGGLSSTIKQVRKILQ